MTGSPIRKGRRPRRWGRWVLQLLGLLAAGQGFAQSAENAFEAAARLGRGINLGNAFEAPEEGAWGLTVERAHLERIAAAGFLSVRLPVRWSAHAEAAPPHTIDPAFFDRIGEVIDWARELDLRVVMTMHNYTELAEDHAAHRDRFLALWDQIARRYRDVDAGLLFELLDNPAAPLDPPTWNGLVAETVEQIRRTNPGRMLVVGPADGYGIDALDALALPERDRALIATVHYYEPLRFTQQGASSIGAASDVGTPWNGSTAERAAVRAAFDQALLWSRKVGRPVYLGAFGTYYKADPDSRARWTAHVRQTVEARDMAWAYWDFATDYGIYDQVSETWRQPLLDALIPPPPKPES